MKLYSYWRSTTSYRVRVALHLKGIAFDTIAVDLVAGDQRAPDYAAINPVKGVPTLVTDTGETLTQSMAILDWLEDTHPDPPLLPQNSTDRAHARAAALTMATDVHPVNNLRVVQHLKTLGHSQDDAVAWMRHWMHEGLTAYAAQIGPTGPFSFGDALTLADVCLVAQLYNAHRWGVDLAPFPRLTQIETHCLTLDAFQLARPEAQPDAT